MSQHGVSQHGSISFFPLGPLAVDKTLRRQGLDALVVLGLPAYYARLLYYARFGFVLARFPGAAVTPSSARLAWRSSEKPDLWHLYR
ncbi:MAG: hypothetical protein ACR5K7_02680 [Symbiopectobacterium sp.]